MEIYVVKQGDSVDSIASAFNISAQTVAWDNQIEYPFRLAVGQALYISDGNPVRDRTPLYTSGYAYPFIDSDTLEETLPFLNGMMIFSYGFTMEGELVPPMADDGWMIERARRWGTRPILTLTSMGKDGYFNSGLVSGLVRDHELQQRLIWELGRTIQEKGMGGLDIDFEYVQADDREGFAAFVGLVTRVLNLFGYPVSVALAPKTWEGQKGVLYEGIDYGLLGAAANRAMLMTYEWGYSQGPPMAVAPIHMVRRVVDYAVTAIPREKLSLGIPNYGYDWPLPFVQGVTRARTISHTQAVELAIDFGAEIMFDRTAMSPYFHYWLDGIRHEVWFEDVRSMGAKFELIKEYGLSGAGYWQLMNLFRANWLMLEQMFYIEGEGAGEL